MTPGSMDWGGFGVGGSVGSPSAREAATTLVSGLCAFTGVTAAGDDSIAELENFFSAAAPACSPVKTLGTRAAEWIQRGGGRFASAGMPPDNMWFTRKGLACEVRATRPASAAPHTFLLVVEDESSLRSRSERAASGGELGCVRGGKPLVKAAALMSASDGTNTFALSFQKAPPGGVAVGTVLQVPAALTSPSLLSPPASCHAVPSFPLSSPSPPRPLALLGLRRAVVTSDSDAAGKGK